MKKLLLFISLFIFFIVPVKADTLDIQIRDYYYYTTNQYFYTNFTEFLSTSNNRDIFNTLYTNIMNNYSSISSSYPYYSLGVNIFSKTSGSFTPYYIALYLECNPSSEYLDFFQTRSSSRKLVSFWYNDSYYLNFSFSGSLSGASDIPENIQSETGLSIWVPYTDPSFYPVMDNLSWVPFNAFQTNISGLTFSDRLGSSGTINLYNSDNQLITSYTGSDPIPYLYYSDNPYNPDVSTLTTVNLDDYEYVLLTLKDYNQTQAFQTNLQVKGQIGITPIYNYGQTSKDSITGSQVQDRCNVSYNSYTTYPFYILQSDLQNNVVYAVASCESGSSFKFDNTIFDITYVTSQNADNPTVTIGGKTYDVIPYDDLPSTATKNEEDNYIPGQSGSAVDSGGIDSAIKGVQQGLSTLWNTFTYFTDLVGLIFSSLPTELRTILLSAFVVAITIGLIKLFTN